MLFLLLRSRFMRSSLRTKFPFLRYVYDSWNCYRFSNNILIVGYQILVFGHFISSLLYIYKGNDVQLVCTFLQFQTVWALWNNLLKYGTHPPNRRNAIGYSKCWARIWSFSKCFQIDPMHSVVQTGLLERSCMHYE